MNLQYDKIGKDTTPTPVTQEFKDFIKGIGKPLTKICKETGMNPSRLSRILCGREIANPQDERLIELAENIGFPVKRIFESKKPTG